MRIHIQLEALPEPGALRWTGVAWLTVGPCRGGPVFRSPGHDSERAAMRAALAQLDAHLDKPAAQAPLRAADLP